MTGLSAPLFPAEFIDQVETLPYHQFEGCWVGLLLDTMAWHKDIELGDMARMLIAVRERYRARSR